MSFLQSITIINDNLSSLSFFFDSKTLNDFKAPATSLVHHIYQKINKTDTCFIYSNNQFNTFFQKEGNNFFTLIPNVLKEIMKFMFGGLIKSDTYVETNLVVYESLRTFIAKKNLEINKKKAVKKHFGLWTEHGYPKKFYRNTPNFFGIGAKRSGKNDFVHYNSLG